MIHLTEQEHTIVKNILGDYAKDTRVFGSRAKGIHKKFSDLDLCITHTAPLPLEEVGRLAHAFTESDLPFTVDVVEYVRVSDSFKKIIDKESLPL
jgi:predicted nucleotidyltransferase